MRTGVDAPLGMFRGIVVFPRLRGVTVPTVGHEFKYNETRNMKNVKDMKDGKQNIRYLGFASVEDGARQFDFAITATGQQATRVSLVIPALMFTGANKITFQESAKICYEKLRVLLEREKLE